MSTLAINITEPSSKLIKNNFKTCIKSRFRLVDLENNCIISNSDESGFPELLTLVDYSTFMRVGLKEFHGHSTMKYPERYSTSLLSKEERRQLQHEKVFGWSFFQKNHDEISGIGHMCSLTSNKILLLGKVFLQLKLKSLKD